MYKIIFLMIVLIGMTGCDKAKDVLGLNREVPDEFEIPAHRPLEMPPDFLLPFPKPGAPRPQEIEGKRSIQAKLLGDKQEKETFSDEDDDMPTFKSPIPKKDSLKQTSGARYVLYEAGTSSRQSGIRDLVNLESHQDDDDDTSSSTFMQELSAMKKMALKN